MPMRPKSLSRESRFEAAKSSPLQEELRFLRGLLASPRRVGAIAPSSPFLARAVAAQLDPAKRGPVLELGPGTGSMTREILARGISPARLVVIEYDPDFARQIAGGFPGVHVVEGDAFDLDASLGERFAQPFAAIVSGIPLLNHPVQKRNALLEAAFRRLMPGAPLIQFSYGFSSPISPPSDIAVKRAAYVWKNIPPASVWVYRRR